MKTVVYYFTGTGNSLAVAEGLSRALGDCELVPIARPPEASGTMKPEADRVGIVCPVYFFGLPALVADFAARLNPTGIPYVFAIVTMGGSGGSAALRQLDGILRRRRGGDGRGLDAGFMVKMPGNYILMYESPAGRRREQILAMADRQVKEIAGMVSRSQHTKIPWSTIASLVHHLMYPRFIAGVHEADRKFTVDERCTSCGVCAEVCPVGNIRLEAGRPTWLHRCEQCMACIHLCPTEAIQAGPETEKRKRYRHPAVKVAFLGPGRTGGGGEREKEKTPCCDGK